ncbi:hypothetical protein HYN48_04405 [Flavobacterium magnum]|uniref:Lipocalin-like domain-containing protein n=1 Tax=Flavobacterium magnum TaxID=2162713 RepID=A0A2S0RCI0_9FLAO|nr:hypothetical protein [Flavobacterium magnum]AWA29386.1 hypothetical protein HYN48_04405 [Flavobacterium magnum]
MKNFKLYMLAAAGCFAITSCSSDDDNGSNNNNVSDDLTGTYELTAANTSQAQDYDGDGDTSTNLVTEGSCYNDSWISFHNDGTYDESYSYSTKAEGGLKLECHTELSSGTFTRNGNNITTTRTSGSGSLNASYTFNASSHTLVRNASNATQSRFDEATALWVDMTSSLQLTFEKYTDNDEDNGNTDDDDDNVSTSGMAEIMGNFGLSSLLTSNSQDLDNDGDSSSNLLNETSCYSDSKIKFNNNGTYEETRSFSTLGNLGLSLTCDSETRTGTWTRVGDRVFTRSSGNGSVRTAFDLDATTNILSRSENNGDYPSFNSLTNVFAMLSGNLDYEYEKSSN